MEVKRTITVKLDVPAGWRADLHASIRRFNDAADYTVENGRDEDGLLILNKSTIHDEVYHDLRERTTLPANMCIRAYSKAIEAMKSTVAAWQNGQSRPLPSFD